MEEPSNEMASLPNSLQFSQSHESAICFLPPNKLQSPINSIRHLYDKSYDKWPPHVNLVYPFVHPEAIATVVDALCKLDLASLAPRTISLHQADHFKHRNHNTIILRPKQDGMVPFASELVNSIRQKIGWPIQDDYQPHMTVGQTESAESDSHNFLLDKARLLTPVNWDVGQLAILVRSSGPSTSARTMRLWGFVNLGDGQLERFSPPLSLRAHMSGPDAYSQNTFEYSPSTLSWQPWPDTSSTRLLAGSPIQVGQLVVASYNVLAEFEWPPDAARYPYLVSNILSDRATSDVLVLQEVTDHFLSYLLQHPAICTQYRFSTHGPPSQGGHAPLPSLINIVILSKLAFSWDYLPFTRRHKGAAVLKLTVSQGDSSPESKSKPIILAACHLTQGLVDGAVVAKKNELNKLMNHLSTEFPGHPWIIAGDFNLATSAVSIDLALKKGQLSAAGCKYLREIDEMFSSYGLQDAWLFARLRSGVSQDSFSSSQSPEKLFEGEQGATFDPLTNHLAAKAVGSGLNNRPQRYDRILFNNALLLRVCGFNIFGRPISHNGPEPLIASDHWGIRCLFKRLDRDDNSTYGHISKTTATEFRKAPPSLGDLEALKTTLLSLGCFPTQNDEDDRNKALQLLQKVLCDSPRDQRARSGLDIVLISVGSYGLGVWTVDSDVDCLCVGNISSKTFFTLAISKLKKARDEHITILRIVRAKTGTMLELSVLGVKFDLQYCAAALIAERYPDIMNYPATDQAFNLPAQTLLKLKPARDLAYLKRSIPDMAKYRLAHLLIKAWAKSRGLYSAKFGLLGGINISTMLVPICKHLAHHWANVTTADILTTFYHHYANFEWKKDIVVDHLFHGSIKYHRTQRESMCLLGWHAPSLNTALNASVSTVDSISKELARARDLLLQDGVSWDVFLRRTEPLSLLELTACTAAHFLQSYKTYVKIDARYWGSSPSNGRRFVGWLESRCVMILVDINRKVPTLMTRVWPAKFILPASQKEDIETPESHCSYLIGLMWQDDDANQTKEETKTAERSLHTVLRDFENRIRGDEKYFDSNSCWLMASLVGRNDAQQLQLDLQPWEGENAGDTDSGEDFDEDEVEDGEVGMVAAVVPSLGSPAVGSSCVGVSGPAAKSGGTGKLRTAADVMNRLRWDSAMDSSNYLVGYEDRFTGAQEKALEQWKSEQTDEEFIPQHRILYFKRKTDGTIVWERRTRTDNVFGSGI